MHRPYLRNLGVREGVALWLVDGWWIRDQLDIEFTNGAHHYSRPYVPEREVWIDREARGAREIPFLVAHQITERRLMAQGLPYEVALRRASRFERDLRRVAGGGGTSGVGVGGARQRVRRRILGAPRVLGTVRESVWLVDGRGVRDLFHPDFTEGGHGLRYRFVPRGEIWIDDALRAGERLAVIVHEVIELRLMRTGMRYPEAHEHASRVEIGVRAHGLPAAAAAVAAR